MGSSGTAEGIKQQPTSSPVNHDMIQHEDYEIGQFGYQPELRRRFGFWSMVGLSSSIMITWEGWLLVCNVSIVNGGKTGSIFSFLFAWLGNIAVLASLAELISMIPTAGGQYHWVYVLAPERYRKFLSWVTGWQMVLAWQADLASVIYLVGTLLQSLVVLNWPEYGFKRWHGTLLIWGVILFALIFNTMLARLLPTAEGSVLILHCLSFLVVMVPLLYFAPHASAREVFDDFQALGGYSAGTSFFVGLLSTVFAFLGADGAIHMCEEVRDARRNVPNALMVSVMLNGILGFAMVVVTLFTIGDLSDALKPKTGFFFVDYFAGALQSNRFTTGLTSLFLVILFFACVAITASTSRVTWAFARDNGLPWSSWLKQVSASSRLPLPAIFFSGLFSFLLSFINIGSPVAFNAIVSLVVAAFYGTYLVPITVLVVRRLTHQPLTFGPWCMGQFGLYVNLYALCFLIVGWVFSFFPIAIPITPTTMNWSCVLWAGTMLVGGVSYFAVLHHTFSGPKVISGTMEIP